MVLTEERKENIFFYFPGHNILHVDFYIDQDTRSKNNIWIYWVDFEENKHNGIYRIKPDGTEKQHVISVSGFCIIFG